MEPLTVGETPLVPPELAEKIRDYYPGVGTAWLDELPVLVERCVVMWDLTLLPAFSPGGESSWTAPVRLPDGAPAVLQLTVPMPVVHDHVNALRAWNGHGAVRPFAHEPSIRATLTERCVPGTEAMGLSADEADAVATSVLPQLWSADPADASDAVPLATVCTPRAEVMEARAGDLAGRGDVGAFRDAAALFRSLPDSTDRTVLVHGDFSRRNVLLSERGWLAIDPSTAVGDPAFDVGMFLQHDYPSRSRVDRLAGQLGLHRDRTRAWVFALLIQGASWCLAVGEDAEYRADVAAAAALV